MHNTVAFVVTEMSSQVLIKNPIPILYTFNDAEQFSHSTSTATLHSAANEIEKLSNVWIIWSFIL